MKKVLITSIIGLFPLVFFAKGYTIHGTVRDSLSGETLIGANIYIKETRQGTSSNAYGFYSVSLPRGRYSIVCTYLGYKPQESSITLNKMTP